MSRLALLLACLSVVAIALRLTGLWRAAGGIGLGLVWAAVIVALASIVNNSDRRSE